MKSKIFIVLLLFIGSYSLFAEENLGIKIYEVNNSGLSILIDIEDTEDFYINSNLSIGYKIGIPINPDVENSAYLTTGAQYQASLEGFSISTRTSLLFGIMKRIPQKNAFTSGSLIGLELSILDRVTYKSYHYDEVEFIPYWENINASVYLGFYFDGIKTPENKFYFINSTDLFVNDGYVLFSYSIGCGFQFPLS